MDDQNQTPASAPVPQTPEVPVSAAEVSPAPVTTAPPAPEKKEEPSTGVVTKGEKFLAMFGYIQFLCVLPLALKPKSKYCQFHGKQSLVLVLLFFVLSWIGWIAKGFGMIIAFANIVIIIIAMLKASQGKLWRIPFVSQVADKLDWDE